LPLIRLEGKEIILMLNVKDDAMNRRLLATERGEPERSEGEPNGVANNHAAAVPPPDPEVLAHSKRRRFTPAYKARIVEEAMACTEPGQIGALMRREGLYSSALTLWRRHTNPVPSRPSRMINAAANARVTLGTRNWDVYEVRLSD